MFPRPYLLVQCYIPSPLYCLVFALLRVRRVSQVVTSLAGDDANIIFGAVVDDQYEGEVHVTIVATGFEPAFEDQIIAGKVRPLPTNWAEQELHHHCTVLFGMRLEFCCLASFTHRFRGCRGSIGQL